jgi:hypothetical protein
MRAVSLARGDATAARLEGRVVAHDVRAADRAVVAAKGTRLDRDAAAAVLAAPWAEVHLLDLDPGDLLQDPAGERLARAAAGDGVRLGGATAGQWTLAAARRGLLKVDVAALNEVNALDGVAVFTLFDGQVVDAEEPVARAKATRLVVDGGLLAEAEARARQAGGLVRVTGFRPLRTGAVVAESLDNRGRARFEAALAEKMAWFGSTLVGVRYAGDPGAVAEGVREVVEAGADLVMVGGAAALDPLDPIYVGLERAGARMERHGVPAHPGTHVWLARLGGTPLVGIPACGMFSQATILDVVLPRLLAGEPVGSRGLAALGHGGLLTRDLAFRFPPYRAQGPRGALD